MSYGFRSIPDGVVLNPLSTLVFDVLVKHTSFPWAVMLAQANRIKADPASLTPKTLRQLTPIIALAVGRFTSQETGMLLNEALGALADGS